MTPKIESDLSLIKWLTGIILALQLLELGLILNLFTTYP